MRRLAGRVCLGVLFALFLLAADAPIPITEHAGTIGDPALIYNSATVAVVFDDVYTPIGVTIARFDIEVATHAGTWVTTFSWTGGWTVGDGVVRVPIRTEAATLANGGYQVRARVWDNFGNVSEYSDPCYVVKQWRVLERPGGCRTVP